MAYRVHEAFYTLQGEGARTGRAAVFCRFSGCNMWSGKESDRNGSNCFFCDTNFNGINGDGGGEFQRAEALARHLKALWPDGNTAQPYLVFTGGEPSLQLDDKLIIACHDYGFEVAIETNGTRVLPEGLDWITVSPKPGTKLRVTTGDELKLLYPIGIDPRQFIELPFKHFFLQPVDTSLMSDFLKNELASFDSSFKGDNVKSALDYCLIHPRWRLGLQLHKIVGLR